MADIGWTSVCSSPWRRHRHRSLPLVLALACAPIAQAQQASSRIQEEAREGARSDAEQLIERARQEIQLERDAAISDLRSEFADLTITAAERVIRRSLDRKAHGEIIEEVLADAPTGDSGGSSQN